jgi:hypothetical protein
MERRSLLPDRQGAPIPGYAINLAACNPLAGTGILNRLVNTASALGMDVVYDCSTVPASLSQDGTIYNRPSAQAYVNAWFTFLYNTYGTKIQYFEVWNELNTPGYFNGTTTGSGNDLWVYAKWINGIVKALNSNAKIISPSYTIVAGATALGTWLSSSGGGGNSKIDIVGFHAYRGASGYRAFDPNAINAIVTQAAANAPGKPIWIT